MASARLNRNDRLQFESRFSRGAAKEFSPGRKPGDLWHARGGSEPRSGERTGAGVSVIGEMTSLEYVSRIVGNLVLMQELQILFPKSLYAVMFLLRSLFVSPLR
jgi:hypothetical protein